MDTLIISAQLVNPPSDVLAFRTLTMLSKSRFHFSNLVEVEAEMKDIYYSYMRAKGIFDYIEQLVTPEEKESGIRMEPAHNYPCTIVVDRIDWSNLNNLMGQLLNLSRII